VSRSFDQLICWITGGGSGIGASLATELAARGGTVAVSGRRVDRLDQVVARVVAAGGRGLAVPCDVTDEASVDAAVREIIDAFGRLDVVVANAGMSVTGKVVDLSAADWRRQLDVNVVGAALTARYAIPHLVQTRGRLALVASVIHYAPVAGNGPYAASKAAVHTLGHVLRAELAASGVSCTTINPGFVASEIAQVDNRGVHHPDRKDRRPAGLIVPTAVAARAIADGIHARRRELVVTGHGKLIAFLGRHFPGLVTWLLSRAGAH